MILSPEGSLPAFLRSERIRPTVDSDGGSMFQCIQRSLSIGVSFAFPILGCAFLCAMIHSFILQCTSLLFFAILSRFFGFRDTTLPFPSRTCFLHRYSVARDTLKASEVAANPWLSHTVRANALRWASFVIIYFQRRALFRTCINRIDAPEDDRIYLFLIFLTFFCQKGVSYVRELMQSKSYKLKTRYSAISAS